MKIKTKTIPDIYDFITSVQEVTGWVSLTEAFDFTFKPQGKSRARIMDEFEKKWRATHRSILKKVSAKPGSFGIDIGCGNGQLLESAQKLKVPMVGLTLSPAQAAYIKGNGNKAHVMSYTDPAFVKKYKGKADFVTLIGPVEHFTNPYELSKQERLHPADKKLHLTLRKNVYKEMFKIISKVLKPGGKVYISCIVFNAVHPTPSEMTRNPFLALVTQGVDLWHSTLLQKALYGYYPDKGMLAQCAEESGFKTVSSEDGTNDYYQTSRYWWYLVHQAWMKHPFLFAYRFVQFMFKSPYHAVITLTNILSQSWPWQFTPRKGGTPTKLERLVFQKK